VFFNLFAAAEHTENVCVDVEPHAMIPVQVYILLQLHRTVVANFCPGNFGLFRRNPDWKTLLYVNNSLYQCL